MNTENLQNEQPATRNPQPKTFKRQLNRHERRAALRDQNPKRNDGKYKFAGTRQMMRVWDDSAIYIPRRKKLKGWQKEAKRRA